MRKSSCRCWFIGYFALRIVACCESSEGGAPCKRKVSFIIGNGVWQLTRGRASLTLVCTLPPLFPVALPRAHLQGLIVLWQCKIAELAENILAVFCVATFENVLPQPLRLTNNQQPITNNYLSIRRKVCFFTFESSNYPK